MMQEIISQLRQQFDRKKERNTEDYGNSYLAFEPGLSPHLEEEMTVMLNKVRKIPSDFFMSVEFCMEDTENLSQYLVSAYTPGPYPENKKCLLFLGSEDETEQHRHDYFEMIYVYQGCRRMQIEGREILLKDKDVCIFDMNCAHLDMRQGSNGIIFNFCFTKKIADSFMISNLRTRQFRELFLMAEKMTSDESYLILHAESHFVSDLEDIVAEMFKEQQNKQVGYERIEQVYLVRMMNCFSGNKKTDIVMLPKNLKGEKLFQAVIKYICTNIATVNVEMLCDQFHYQADYYSRLIRKNTGMSYEEYVRNLRMEMAENLLVNTDMSIKEIMLYLGYQSHSYFYKVFEEKHGMTPTEYRKRRGE